jgi:hypothetical protein
LPDQLLWLNGRARQEQVQDALNCSVHTSGKTHNFYHYPARFSPEFARTIISEFSKPGELVLDPFMGGGTSITEGLTLGRFMLGVDLNALAHFVAATRTTPLSPQDEERIIAWSDSASSLLGLPNLAPVKSPVIRNLPQPVRTFVAGALEMASTLPLRRQRNFARCALLRLGQWALDCRDFSAPRRRRLGRQLPSLVRSLLIGLQEFVEQCRLSGVTKSQITGHRLLLNRSVVGLYEEARLRPFMGRVNLVLTSPPYPRVHVLYHRWQYRGRKETPAPYWIANVPDGSGEAFYTFGSRKSSSMDKYFTTLKGAFTSIRPLLAHDALVAQLVAFSDAEIQLPCYLAALEDAGFQETFLPTERSRLSRLVPNRKWYARLREQSDAATEILLIHRMIPWTK